MVGFKCSCIKSQYWTPLLLQHERLHEGLFGQKASVQTFVFNSILNTGLKFSCMLRDFLCPWHWLLIDFNIIRNCIQKFVLRYVTVNYPLLLWLTSLHQLLSVTLCIMQFMQPLTFSAVLQTALLGKQLQITSHSNIW